jgi:eukaryotic-like serine/threonine-protein kinase
MQEHVTILGPQEPHEEPGGLSSSLPPDLLEQIRGRVRLLALLLLVAFSFDPLVYLGIWLYLTVAGYPVIMGKVGFRLLDVGAMVASGTLWWAARRRVVSPERLHTLGLLYQVAISFVIALTSFWQTYIDKHIVPSLTWVPVVVILFPLILPGPPRRMLIAAIAAGAMAPLALLVLDMTEKVPADGGAYVDAVFSSMLAIGFAYMGARVIYRLGREVAAARQLGSYRLEEKLGQGGMGEVWRARHRMLARPAAIKLIRPGIAENGRRVISDDARRRFEREAQVIARLRSPHTVNLFDFGVAEDGAFYYVMELLDGMDADRLVKRFGPLPPERAIFILRQICHSLSEAESYGLVHRDIKPANIFLCRYGEDYDFVKVLDFGLVKALDDESDADGALTREHTVHGTPAFIAPEQALGKKHLDGRVDIYATGCVAYWLLTGELVFKADTGMGLLMQHVHALPAPPSSRTELPIPPELDELVLQCLAKDPEQRPQSARELAQRLTAIRAEGMWTEVRAQAWWIKHEPVAV